MRLTEESFDMPDEVEKEHLKLKVAHFVSAGLELALPSHLEACPCCNRETIDIKKRRLNTAYVKDEANWLESCYDCYQQRVDHYSELWTDYYLSRGV